MTFRNRRLFAAAVLTIGLAGAGVWIAYSVGNHGAEPPAPRKEPVGDPARPRPPAIPAVTASLYLNTKSTATFVGTKKCIECHEEQHRSFLATSHSRALRRVSPADEPPDAEFHHGKSGRSFRIYRKNGELRHREFIPVGEKDDLVLGDFPVAYTIGSGHHSRSYLLNIDGFLVESPATWYASRKAWEISPGYDKPRHLGFTRPADARCVSCHAGQVESVEGSLHRLRISETIISCESCHGPGSLHVRRRKLKTDIEQDIDDTIVNPADLSRALKESICARCHQKDAASVEVRGRSLNDFRPGLPLSDFRVDYRLDRQDTSMKVTGHFEQMRQSRCYTQTKTLTCTTCHNPHGRPESIRKVEHFRNKCLSCHQDEGGCRLPEPARLKKSPKNDCVKCHMPKADTDIPHFAFTHHRIGLKQKLKYQKPASAGRLVPVDDVSRLSTVDRERCLGLGYLEASRFKDKRIAVVYRRRANAILDRVYDAGVRDADVVAALAMLYLERRSPRAVALAQEALKTGDGSPNATIDALQILGDHHLRNKQWKDAIRVFERLVRLHRHPKNWAMLGVARTKLNDWRGALAAFQKAVAIRHDRPDLHVFLAQAYERLGKPALAKKHFELAKRLAKLERAGDARPP